MVESSPTFLSIGNIRSVYSGKVFSGSIYE
jgi:hypothetical protein